MSADNERWAAAVPALATDRKQDGSTRAGLGRGSMRISSLSGGNHTRPDVVCQPELIDDRLVIVSLAQIAGHEIAKAILLPKIHPGNDHAEAVTGRPSDLGCRDEQWVLSVG